MRLVDIWLGTPMTEARYIRRLLKIRRLEESGGHRPSDRMLNPNDLQRLVEIITEEVMSAQRRAASAPAQCSCHAVLYDCCPDRLRGVLDAGASRIGLHATGGAAGTVAGMIDHTLLKPDATRQEIEKLCREAAEFHFATVCVNPAWVATAGATAPRLRRRRLLGRRVPAGRDDRRRQALRDPPRDLRRRRRDRHGDQHRRAEVRRSQVVERDIAAVVGPCREAKRRSAR